MPKIKELIPLFEKIAPPSYAESWDNCGLLAGSSEWEVKHILFTLDITPEVIKEAVTMGADLIFSHHPLIFKPISSVTEKSLSGELLLELLSRKIAVYSAHTCLDAADAGVNDTLCSVLGCKPVGILKSYAASDGQPVSCGCIAELQAGMPLSRFLTHTKSVLHAPMLRYSGDKSKSIKRLAVCCGAGDSVLDEVLQAQPDLFLTGEIKYHTELALKQRNISFVEAGHYQTERPVLHTIIMNLQNQISMLQYAVTFTESNTITDPCDCE